MRVSRADMTARATLGAAHVAVGGDMHLTLSDHPRFGKFDTSHTFRSLLPDAPSQFALLPTAQSLGFWHSFGTVRTVRKRSRHRSQTQQSRELPDGYWTAK